MTDHELVLEREMLVRASAATIFRYFTDPARTSAWFGTGSSIDARPGGAVIAQFAEGSRAEGVVLEVESDRRIVFTWGFAGADSPLPPGASTIHVELEPVADGTVVHLRHHLPTDEMVQAYRSGWRHHLSHLATKAARDDHAGAAELLDRWYKAWRGIGRDDRRDIVAALCTPNVELVDDLVTVTGLDEVVAHIDNAAMHLPGIEIRRDGPVQTVADHATCAWVLTKSEAELGRGRTVATLTLDGRLRRIIGFWDVDPDEVSRRVHRADGG